MDRKAWIVVVLCVAALGLWQWAYVQYYAPTPEQLDEQRRAAEEAQAAAPTPAPVAETTAATPAPAAPAPAAPAEEPSVPRETRTVTTGLADFQFASDTGGIASIELLDHLGEDGANVALNIPQALPVGTLSEEPGLALGGFASVSPGAPNEAVFLRRQPDGLQIRKTYIVSEADEGKGDYVVDLTLDFTNTGEAALQRTGFYLSTGGAAPVHSSDMTMYTGFDWYRDGKATFTDVNCFVSIVAVTDGDPGTAVWARRLDLLHGGDEQQKVFGIEGALGLPGFRLEPGETKSWTFQIYTGPKDLGRLSKLGQGEQEVMNFGIFKWVSEILLYSMNALYGVLGNFAAAIIALTIIIKALLWPLQNKATNSMRKMAALSPKMTELREKYKDDPTKMNQELMKLYKDYGVNPFSGCFPMLIQIPIFFGFYSMLGTAIELRNSSFLWVHDLSQPDTVGHIFGFPINILPILMALTMLWQMHITPKTGDAVQQRMFMFMPLIFILFAYNFASALSLYWTTQNIISIIQLYATRNKPLPVLEKKAVVQKKALEGGKGKKRRSGK
jgi:YidC/Oxa1 family membrane protein insertase